MSRRKWFADWRGLLEGPWTDEKAWFLGIMYGDGNVYRRNSPGCTMYSVTVSGSLDTTSKVAGLWRYNKKPKRVTENGWDITVRDKEFVEWFETSYGICGPKAHKLIWPHDLPEGFELAFIRGLWDSDGSLGIEEREHFGNKGHDRARLSYSSICKPFVYLLRDKLEAYFPVPRVIVSEPTEDSATYRVSYGGSSAMLVAHGVYDNAPTRAVNQDRLDVFVRMVELETLIREEVCGGCGIKPKHLMQGLCHPCWWDRRGRTKAARVRIPKGDCACGQPQYRRDQCWRCYARTRKEARLPAPTGAP